MRTEASTKRFLIPMAVLFCALSANAQTRDIKTEEANKKLVAAFYQAFFGDHDFSSADKYLDAGYIQHNPTLPDGRDALVEKFKVFFANVPKRKEDIRQIAADGDLVWLHVRVPLDEGPASFVDIFRVKDGKIVEHWDIIQAIPQKSANPHPMF